MKGYYKRENVFEYFMESDGVASYKHSPEHWLCSFYWFGTKIARICHTRPYFIRLFIKGFKDWYFEYGNRGD